MKDSAARKNLRASQQSALKNPINPATASRKKARPKSNMIPTRSFKIDDAGRLVDSRLLELDQVAVDGFNKKRTSSLQRSAH